MVIVEGIDTFEKLSFALCTPSNRAFKIERNVAALCGFYIALHLQQPWNMLRYNSYALASEINLVINLFNIWQICVKQHLRLKKTVNEQNPRRLHVPFNRHKIFMYLM